MGKKACRNDAIFSKLKKTQFHDFKMAPATENGVYYIRNQCIEIQQKCRKFLDDGKICEKFENVIKYMLSNPLLLLTFIIISSTIILPVFLFTIFAIINVAIAFASFIIIEVILLMIGITVVCSTMFFVLSVVAIIGISFILSFYVMYFSVSLVRKKLHCQ